MVVISLAVALLSLALAGYSLYLHRPARRSAPVLELEDAGATARVPATFIVEFWARVFGVLSWISTFKLLTRVVRPTYASTSA